MPASSMSVGRECQPMTSQLLARRSVYLSLDSPQHFEQTLERRRFAEDHFLHFSVVLLQLRQTSVRRDDSQRARLGVRVPRPSRREEDFLVAGYLQQQVGV